MGPQHNAANATVITHLANQEQAGLPVRIGARPQLHKVSDIDRTPGFGANEASGVSFAEQERFENGEFLACEHIGEPTDAPK
jgi:hypothetical protein